MDELRLKGRLGKCHLNEFEAPQVTFVHRVNPLESELAPQITQLVNRAFVQAQSELFATPSPRVSVDSMVRIIQAGELVVAERSGKFVGAVMFRDFDERSGFFGMLAVAPESASNGIARQILEMIETDARSRGREVMELDLLMPEPATAYQLRLRSWYERRGYLPQHSRPFADIEPEHVSRLRNPTSLIRFAKVLSPYR